MQTRTNNSVGLWLAACVMACGVAASPAAAQPGSDLKLRHLDSAIHRAITSYYDKITPPWTFDRTWLLEKRHYYNNWKVEHAMGNHALMIWAALSCGESYQNPPLYRRLNWVLSLDYSHTYDRGMRLQMLAQLPPSRWAPWVRRDGLMLSKALTVPDENGGIPGGAFNAQYTDGVATGWGDAANTQYGALGLAAAQYAGIRVRSDAWRLIDRYWRLTQRAPAGGSETGEQRRFGIVNPAAWAVVPAKGVPTSQGSKPFYNRLSGPMTAGAVTSLCVSERQLRGADMKHGDRLSLELRRGIAWLDNRFTLSDADEESDWFYYMYNVQNVGRATGYRTFNGINWFRQVTAELLSRQGGDGFWNGPKGKLLSTGFALLYLARAKDPVAISKIRWKMRIDPDTGEVHRDDQTAGPPGAGAGAEPDAAEDEQWIVVDGAWDNYPHDMWNFVEYVSGQYETDTTWQIVELDQPVNELIESPILYLATDKTFRFTDTQVQNLRHTIEAGGLLITVAQGTNRGPAVRSIRALTKQLFPDLEWSKVPKTHAFYNLHQQVKAGLPMQMIDNGLRPLIVHLDKDVSEDLQKRKTDTDSYRVLSNIYLYATGMAPRRPRLNSNYVVQIAGDPSRRLPAARLRHSGAFDPEPNALRQLKALLANDHDLNLDYEPVGISATELSDQKLAFISTSGDGALTKEEAQALRRWVDAGGTLWIDAAGGSEAASQAARQMYKSILPGSEPIQLPREHPIITGSKDGEGGRRAATVRFRFFMLRAMGPARHARVFAHLIDGRAAMILTPEDTTCGLAGLDHWGIFGYSPESARRLVVNGALMVAKNAAAKAAPMARASRSSMNRATRPTPAGP